MMLGKILSKMIKGDGGNEFSQDVPGCPICDTPAEVDERGPAGCSHFVGAWNEWYSEDDTLADQADDATHYVRWQGDVSGVDYYFFRE